MSALEALIAGLIVEDGPMRLDRFMALALGHPAHGYYMTRDPFGVEGDFLTAPEVSQVFGELIGVWCATAWQAMGKPAFQLVELGPGRGTLMADVLRATRRVPGFPGAATVHFVETSPVLREKQKQAVPHATWHADLSAVPQGPTLLLANEFFDALPVRQFERRAGGWQERVIGLEQGHLALGLMPAPGFQPPPWAGRDGDIVEVASASQQVAAEIGQRLRAHPGHALIIDYGHAQSAPGDTLQALQRHAYVPITTAPGTADLTTHVDFETLARGLALPASLLTQRAFLLAMGLEQRFSALAARADRATQASLARAKSRLADQDQMGNLFKVLAVHSPGLAPPYPFGAV